MKVVAKSDVATKIRDIPKSPSFIFLSFRKMFLYKNNDIQDSNKMQS